MKQQVSGFNSFIFCLQRMARKCWQPSACSLSANFSSHSRRASHIPLATPDRAFSKKLGCSKRLRCAVGCGRVACTAVLKSRRHPGLRPRRRCFAGESRPARCPFLPGRTKQDLACMGFQKPVCSQAVQMFLEPERFHLGLHRN